MQNVMNGCINHALALKGAYPEIYRFKATYFCCRIEVGAWGTGDIRQLFPGQNRQCVGALIP